jgi:hypothetical protein
MTDCFVMAVILAQAEAVVLIPAILAVAGIPATRVITAVMNVQSTAIAMTVMFVRLIPAARGSARIPTTLSLVMTDYFVMAVILAQAEAVVPMPAILAVAGIPATRAITAVTNVQSTAIAMTVMFVRLILVAAEFVRIPTILPRVTMVSSAMEQIPVPAVVVPIPAILAV